jgi:hypothetical protein
MRTLQVVALVAVGGLVGGCSRKASTPGEGTPVSSVVALSPAPQATSVPRGAAIGVEFGYPTDSASAAARFTVHMGDSSGPVVPGRMMWDSSYRHMTFVPDSVLSPGTTYTVYMHNGMMTLGSMMGGESTGMGGRGGMGGMRGMAGGRPGMPGSPMMFSQAMPGAMRTGAGMMWSFTTGR